METLTEKDINKNPRNLWKIFDNDKYQVKVTLCDYIIMLIFYKFLY